MRTVVKQRFGSAPRQVAWLVDGLNVVGSRPDGWWRDRPAAMEGLVKRLEDYAAATGEAVTVVFDGKPPEPRPADAGMVEVVFAPRRGPNAADEEIVERTAAHPDPSSLAVVTSDADLAARVRVLGAETVSSGSFRRRLGEVAPEG